MSLYRELDGDVDSLPNLIDEEELLFGGGEDLFGFLDEESADEPVVVNRSEPLGYTAPQFFPFTKSEPTPPSLKLQGVSSLKKINSRLHQGGEMGDTEQTAAVVELERALGVLRHQKSFLSEQKSQLETWTSSVYGLILVSPDPTKNTLDVAASSGSRADGSEGLSEAQKQEESPGREDGVENSCEIRVRLKCKGTEKRKIGLLVARVKDAWRPQRADNTTAGNKRGASCNPTVDKPPKRSKPGATKPEEATEKDMNPQENNVKKAAEQDPPDQEISSDDEMPETPDELWSWLEGRNYFLPISRRQPLTEDLTLEAEGRLGRSTLIPLQSYAGDTKKTPEDHGVRRDVIEDKSDILRKRLLSALVVPDRDRCGDARKKGVVGATRQAGTERTNQTTRGSHRVLNVTHLSLEQRVLVQLGGVGLFDATCQQIEPRPTEQPGLLHSQRDLAERIRRLNRCKVVLRQEINART